MWHLVEMAARVNRADSRTKANRPAPQKQSRVPTQAERLAYLEEMVNLLLRASLRGHLLPAERRLVKQVTQRRKQQPGKSDKQTQARCPACRSPLMRPRLQRCPWCSVLLAEARRGLKKAAKKR